MLTKALERREVRPKCLVSGLGGRFQSSAGAKQPKRLPEANWTKVKPNINRPDH